MSIFSQDLPEWRASSGTSINLGAERPTGPKDDASKGRPSSLGAKATSSANN